MKGYTLVFLYLPWVPKKVLKYLHRKARRKMRNMGLVNVVKYTRFHFRIDLLEWVWEVTYMGEMNEC